MIIWRGDFIEVSVLSVLKLVSIVQNRNEAIFNVL